MGPLIGGIPPGAGAALLGATLAVPLALLVLLPLPSIRARAPGLTPWAALPALVAGLTVPEGTALELPWLVIGVRLELDPLARPFLLLAGVLYAGAGAFLLRARKPVWLCGFFLAALAGNLGVILAPGAVGFYSFYSLMGLAIYGLVIAPGGRRAHRAANVYIVFTVVGEVLLFGALVAAEPSGAGAGVVPMVLAGLGIKLGLVPLHLWVPLAYGAAPPAAGAVLGGSMVNAGLIGWLRFLPLGEAALPGWGELLVALGLAAAFLGVVVGLAQAEPRVVLAYSSISQMGWITVAVGAGLLAPGHWHGGLLAAVIAYAVHHGLAKGTLFLAVGTVQGARPGSARGRAAMVVLVLLALVLAGGPGTSGAAAKLALKDALAHLPGADPALVSRVLAWGAAATTLLMVRLVLLARPRAIGGPAGPGPGGWTGLGALAALAVVLPFAWPALRPEAAASLGAKAASVGLPVGIGVLGGGLAAWALRGRHLPRRLGLPPGDILWLLLAGARPVLRAIRGHAARLRSLWIPGKGPGAAVRFRLWEPVRDWLMAADRWGWAASGIALLVLLGALVLALVPWT